MFISGYGGHFDAFWGWRSRIETPSWKTCYFALQQCSPAIADSPTGVVGDLPLTDLRARVLGILVSRHEWVLMPSVIAGSGASIHVVNMFSGADRDLLTAAWRLIAHGIEYPATWNTAVPVDDRGPDRACAVMEITRLSLRPIIRTRADKE